MSGPPVAAGNKIGAIENLGATLDQFDAIDFSDNDIRKLDGFPLLKRLKTVYLSNNRIMYARPSEPVDAAPSSGAWPGAWCLAASPCSHPVSLPG